MKRWLVVGFVAVVCASFARGAEELPKWAKAADEKKPMTAEETRGFMKTLARYVEENHLKKKENSAQRGMIYEYFDVRRKGEFDQFVQGEALDTMHDGAWFGAGLVAAYRATGDEYYRVWLVRWVIPFYCNMLNNSDTLFALDRDDANPKATRFKGENAHTPGEKGFVPYWWDDGGSVSFERRRKKQRLGDFSCVDNLAGKENPNYLLDGYSRGSSNHMAQDLGVFVQQAWLLMKDGEDETSRKLARELAEAAKSLAENRRRRHGRIPMCEAPTALANKDAAAMKALPKAGDERLYRPENHYTKAVRDFKAGQRYSVPGFADDQEYRYYAGIAQAGGELPRPLAFKLIFDAYTQPMLYRMYSDDAPVPPGIGVFDLHPYYFRDGKPEDYRSQRKGPGKRPRPIGSRFGPQNMAVSGWALQALRKWPGVWDEQRAKGAHQENVDEAAVKVALERELGGGLRTWEAIFDEHGYIPSGMGTGQDFDHFSDSGGYAHLLHAAAEWLMYLEGKSDWEIHRVPKVE
jgi:hypothetical protein